ncbi:MAG: hypothetical protein ACE5MB_04640 [Anaerolineae bacterium]
MTRGRPLRPDVQTKFHIDLAWWERRGRDFRLYLQGSLCPDCQKEYANADEVREMDWVDPETAEVRRLDELWVRLLSCCSLQADYITPATPLTTAIFRALLASGNRPLSPLELHERIGKSNPQTILRVLTGKTTHYGIVPAGGQR